MKLKTVNRDGINERAYIVVDDSGIPVDHICWFTVTELSGWANNTQQFVSRNVIHIEKWAREKGINLIDEFNQPPFLEGRKFKSLIRHLERYSSDTSNVAEPIAPRLVVPKYFNDRIDTCIKYFDYLVRIAVDKRLSNDPFVAILEESLEKLNNKLIKTKRPKDDLSFREGLSRTEQRTLELAIHEPQIFGWNHLTQLRNVLIIRLFLSTGIRKSELLALHTNDCVTSRLRVNQKPHIIVRQNVRVRDPRKNTPQLKTLPRVIPISENMRKLLEEYKNSRPKIEEVKKQPPYLFLSSRFPHAPLSFSSVNSIFDSALKHLPDLKRLSSHRLRHTFFENFERTLHSNNYDDALKKKLANSIGGWSSKSETRKGYQTLATEEQCQDALEEMHRQFECIYDDIQF